MKKLIFLFLFLPVLLSAQDIIYTVSGEYNQTKVPLDSILIENLSNDTRILFGNLPEHDYYQINLTKNEYWGTVNVNALYEENEFTVTKNLPGLLNISYNKSTPTKVRLSIFNVNGQLVRISENIQLNPKNSLEIRLGSAGIFLVRVEAPFGTRTYKSIGAQNNSTSDFRISDGITSRFQIKTMLKSGETEFSFSPGDSIRVSVYKNEYYARPAGMKISGSAPVNFKFKEDQFQKSGISNAYVALDENTTNVIAYDTITGQVQMEYSGEKPDLMPGDIIIVDVDTMGYMRKIVSVDEIDGILEIETEQAFMNDIFVDREIKLNTGLMNPGVQLKNNSTLEEISRALIDDEGYIHPVEVIYYDSEGKLITKSALSASNDNDNIIPLINFNRDLTKDLYGEDGDPVHFHISEGHVELTSNGIFEFNFEYNGQLTGGTRVERGDLQTFKFYLDSYAGFLTKLALDMNYNYEKKDTKRLIDLPKLTTKFIVPPSIPVWITFDVDIFGHYEFNVDASFHSEWGFESVHNLQVGGLYDRPSDSFTPINEYTPTNTIFPLTAEGEVNASARAEIYPRVDVKFYDFFGPYAEIAPYIKGNYNAAMQSQLTSSGFETFLAWNSAIDLGLDFRVGAELTFLMGVYNATYGPVAVNCFEEPLWLSPHSIELLTDLPEQIEEDTTIQLRFKVTDLLENPVNLCPVYLTGDGTFSDEILFTNVLGEATADWTITDTTNINELKATIFKADSTIIDELTDTINIGCTYGFFTDTRDGKIYKTTKIGDQVWMAENLAYNIGNGCYAYNNNESNVATYGRLYTWDAAIAACPPGWHLPTDDEWKQMEMTIGMSQADADVNGWNRGTDEGTKLQANGWLGYVNGTDDYCFSAIPGGEGYDDLAGTGFSSIGNGGKWWTATELLLDPDDSYYGCCSWYRGMSINKTQILRRTDGKLFWFSVRCVKD